MCQFHNIYYISYNQQSVKCICAKLGGSTLFPRFFINIFPKYFGASSAPFRLVKLKIQAFWFSFFYHFWHFLGSVGGPGTLFCTLNLKIRHNILINELSKMFNNSTKKHSFRKSGYRNEIQPFKKTEKFINRNFDVE